MNGENFAVIHLSLLSNLSLCTLPSVTLLVTDMMHLSKRIEGKFGTGLLCSYGTATNEGFCNTVQ
jgi:hypothetical protein